MEQELTLSKWWTFISAFIGTPLTRAIGVLFACCSWCFASWVVHIPYVKSHLALDDAALGLVLFGLPIGQLFVNPFAGAIVRRWGAARVTVAATFIIAFLLPLPIWATNTVVLTFCLILLGVNFAMLNVSLNTCVMFAEDAYTEQKSPVFGGRSILASCHGMWSTGGVIGSSTASALLAAGIAPRVHILIASGVVLLLLAWAAPHLLTIKDRPRQEGTQKGFILPNRRLAILIVVGLTALFAEGTAFDWSGVFLRDYRHASPSASAMGFVAFTFAMTLVRFTGDLIIPRFGERNLLFAGGLLGASGLMLVVFGTSLTSGWLGFLMLGLGCSLGAPMLFKLSMRLPDVPPATGLATFSTFSFLGFLVGPPAIGWISKAYGLPVGLMIVAGFLSIGALLARRFI